MKNVFVHEGVIEFCGMEKGFTNYLTFVANLDFQIIGQFMVCFGPRLSLAIAD